MGKINIKDFSMSEFLTWLSENDKEIDTIDLKRVDCIATCEFEFK